MKEDTTPPSPRDLACLRFAHAIHTDSEEAKKFRGDVRGHTTDGFIRRFFGSNWSRHPFTNHVRNVGKGKKTDKNQATGAVELLLQELVEAHGEEAAKFGPRDRSGEYPILRFLYEKFCTRGPVDEIRYDNLRGDFIDELQKPPYSW